VIASMRSLIANDCSTVMACSSYPPPGQMNGHALDVFGRLHDTFGHGGMGMDRFGERFCRRAHLHRHRDFVHEVRSMRADEMPAGTTSYRISAGCPRILRTATLPCAEATCANIAFPTTSPIA